MSGLKYKIECHSPSLRLFPRLSVSGKQKPWIGDDEQPPPEELSELQEENYVDLVRCSSQLQRVMTIIIFSLVLRRDKGR